ncbi:MAG: hypothetical protein IPH84_16795, partial [Bacteroidales bacterium]|nr:hypothetical protein [Bacteroidales bacterium]
ETGDRILQYQHSISYNQLKSLYKSKENLADSSNSFKDAIALVGGLTANTYGFIITVIVSTAFGAAVAPIPIAGAIVRFY